jgi:hypothetical protein
METLLYQVFLKIIKLAAFLQANDGTFWIDRDFMKEYEEM